MGPFFIESNNPASLHSNGKGTILSNLVAFDMELCMPVHKLEIVTFVHKIKQMVNHQNLQNTPC